MNKKLYRFSRGIHIERLNKEELAYILKFYYKIDIPQEQSSIRTIDLKKIYRNALSTILLNGYHIPVSRFECLRPTDPYLYYEDMVMMLYLYIVNLAEPISENRLPISTGVQKNLKTVEQSGFGTILGCRRKNKNIANDSDNEKHQKNINDSDAENCQKLERQKHILQKIVTKDSTVENTAKNIKQTVIRYEHETKYSIPAVCQNVLVALIMSRKNNPFLFELSENELEDEAISLFELFEKALNEVLDHEFGITLEYPLAIFSKSVQYKLLTIRQAGDWISSAFYNYFWDTNFKNYDKFCAQYERKLEYAIEKNDNIQYIRKADFYLSELLFAHKYYIDTIQQLNKKMVASPIDKKLIKQFIDTVYKVSESMLCFSRKKHIEKYIEMFFVRKDTKKSAEISNKKCAEKGTDKNIKKDVQKKKLLKKIIKTECYTQQEFAPALYYCFLYYIIEMANRASNSDNNQLLFALQEEIHHFQTELMLPDSNQIKKMLSNENMQLLLFKRKQGFLLPLIYSLEKALF